MDVSIPSSFKEFHKSNYTRTTTNVSIHKHNSYATLHPLRHAFETRKLPTISYIQVPQTQPRKAATRLEIITISVVFATSVG